MKNRIIRFTLLCFSLMIIQCRKHTTIHYENGTKIVSKRWIKYSGTTNYSHFVKVKMRDSISNQILSKTRYLEKGGCFHQNYSFFKSTEYDSLGKKTKVTRKEPDTNWWKE